MAQIDAESAAVLKRLAGVDLETARLLGRLAAETNLPVGEIVKVALHNYADQSPEPTMRDRMLLDRILEGLVSDLIEQLKVLEPEGDPGKSAAEWRTHVVLAIMAIDEMRLRYGPKAMSKDAAKTAAIKAMQDRAGDVEAVYRGLSHFYATRVRAPPKEPIPDV